MDKWQQIEEEVVRLTSHQCLSFHYYINTYENMYPQHQANDPRFKTKEDFTVVLQQFTKNITFPPKRMPNGEIQTDLTYLSDDCFHFSQKGYSRSNHFSLNLPLKCSRSLSSL